MIGPHGAVSMDDDFLPLRRYDYHVLNFMSRGSKKKTGSGKASERSSASVRPAVEMPKKTTARPLAGWPECWTVAGVCVFLAAMVWAVFGQTLGFGFVNFDDNAYIR